MIESDHQYEKHILVNWESACAGGSQIAKSRKLKLWKIPGYHSGATKNVDRKC